jgi:hypothetical protein
MWLHHTLLPGHRILKLTLVLLKWLLRHKLHLRYGQANWRSEPRCWSRRWSNRSRGRRSLRHGHPCRPTLETRGTQVRASDSSRRNHRGSYPKRSRSGTRRRHWRPWRRGWPCRPDHLLQARPSPRARRARPQPARRTTAARTASVQNLAASV